MVKKFYRYVAGILIILATCSLAISSKVSATSIYDDSYQTTDSVALYNTANGSRIACSPVDYSTNLLDLFDQASNPYAQQQNTIDDLKSSLQTAQSNGRWGASEFDYISGGDGYSGVQIYWTEDTSLTLVWQSSGVVRASGNEVKTISFVTQATWLGNSNCEPWARFALNVFPPYVSIDDGSIKNFFTYTDNPNYPVGYEGALVNNPDQDNDGLTLAQELAQGTSDNNKDLDGDGLSDFMESRWNSDRDDVFCDTSCAYPNPTQKDLYVEVDWINKNLTDYKPTATQIDDVIDTYESQGILAHFDTGQYGGGGKIELDDPLIFAPTENELDFYDLKNGTGTISAHFNPIRKNIWRYMIASPNFMLTESEQGSTGASYAGDDDSIISIERVSELNPSNLDTATTGTILHELGHNLCLSNQASLNYPSQPSECIYSEIDKPVEESPSNDYVSVMNYLFQFNMKDYSHGTNGTPDDHNDWQAIQLGIDDFTQSVYEWDDKQNQRKGFKDDISKPSLQDMIDSIQN